MMLNEVKKPKTSDYWRSPDGISKRIEMLAQHFTYKTVNNSLMFYGYSKGVTQVMWVTMEDERVCPICGPLEGRLYWKGQFMAPLPAHANCLTPDTKVQTIRGLIPIKDVMLGDMVLTHKGRYREVIDLHENLHEDKIYKIDDCGLTGNHPILTPEGWVTANSINELSEVYAFGVGSNLKIPPIDTEPKNLPATITEQNSLPLSPIRLGLELCHPPPSISIANLISGTPKSRLYLPIAN